MDIGSGDSFNGSRKKGCYRVALVKGLPPGFGFGDQSKDSSESGLKVVSQNSTTSNLSDVFHSYQTQSTSFKKKENGDFKEQESNCIGCIIT